jgi:hypothetical protein
VDYGGSSWPQEKYFLVGIVEGEIAIANDASVWWFTR